LTALK